MQLIDFFNLFLLISSLFGFGFSLALYFSKNGKDKSMLYLNLLILVISLNNLQSWVLAKGLFQHKFWLDYIQIPWHFLMAPFFYMFMVHYLEIAQKCIKMLRVILLFFILGVILQFYFVIIYSGSAHLEKLNYLYERYTSIEEIISFLISFGVFGYSYFLLAKKENLFPKILSFDNLRWIYTFFIIAAIGYLLWFLALVIKVKMNFTGFIFSYYPLRIYTTILIFWLGYQSIIQLNLLKERRSLRSILRSKQTITSKSDSDDKDDEFNKIHSYILKHNKFTESNLNRDQLAEELGMSKSKLSSIMNSSAQKSFIDFMNELRVEQAKKLLEDSDYKQYTITAVGLESGFNSKSTFFAVFKKYAGKTPAEYRDQKP